MRPPGSGSATYHRTTSQANGGRRAWVALGANLGDPRRALRRAVRWLDATPGARVEARSRIHVTAAVGPPQPDYLNAVVRLRTSLSPMALLDALLTLERAAGRVRVGAQRWGPRMLDLDLLAFEDRVVTAPPWLHLPHPRLQDRRFVLAPWAEIDPGFVVPGLELSVEALLARLGGATARKG